MLDTLTLTLSYAVKSFSAKRSKVPHAISRWAEIEFGKDSGFALAHYSTHGKFPSEKQMR